MTRTPSLQKLLDWYQDLRPETLAKINEIYAADVFFKDPFNEFRSREQLAGIYRHMFEALDSPRFAISQTVSEGNDAFIIWVMEFFLNGKAMSIRGSSHLRYNNQGLVEYHRDYWDAAEELYEKLPLLGWFMKRIKRKLQSPASTQEA